MLTKDSSLKPGLKTGNMHGVLSGQPNRLLVLFIELKANSENNYHGSIMSYCHPFYRIMTTTSGYSTCYSNKKHSSFYIRTQGLSKKPIVQAGVIVQLYFILH
ncbi:hypothetical protein DMA11_09720 [Marinilabiliaceae bacterium JC017]|nr:hypothetical protein DMA11_09720 [Marinilabiliaceae bacterium JC017]